MQALFIVASILGMLSMAAVGTFALLNFLKKLGYPQIILLSAAGLAFLAYLFLMIFGIKPTNWSAIVACIFLLLGLPALAVGFILMSLKAWPKTV